MDLTNPNAKTRLFGFSLSNTVIYVLAAVVLFLGFKMTVVFVNLFKKLKRMLGFGSDESTEVNQEYITKSMENDPAVKSQLTIGARTIADNIYNAINGFGIDEKALFAAFTSITGPNQMKAIYLAYGTRTCGIIPFYNFTGNLIATLKWRLLSYDYNKNLGTQAVQWSIRTKLNWITLS